MRWLKAWFMRAGAPIDLRVLQVDGPVTKVPRATGGVSGRVAGLAAVFGFVIFLGGCETSTKWSDVFRTNSSDDPQTTASVPKTVEEVNDTTGERSGGGPPVPVVVKRSR